MPSDRLVCKQLEARAVAKGADPGLRRNARTAQALLVWIIRALSKGSRLRITSAGIQMKAALDTVWKIITSVTQCFQATKTSICQHKWVQGYAQAKMSDWSILPTLFHLQYNRKRQSRISNSKIQCITRQHRHTSCVRAVISLLRLIRTSRLARSKRRQA